MKLLELVIFHEHLHHASPHRHQLPKQNPSHLLFSDLCFLSQVKVWRTKRQLLLPLLKQIILLSMVEIPFQPITFHLVFQQILNRSPFWQQSLFQILQVTFQQTIFCQSIVQLQVLIEQQMLGITFQLASSFCFQALILLKVLPKLPPKLLALQSNLHLLSLSQRIHPQLEHRFYLQQ